MTQPGAGVGGPGGLGPRSPSARPWVGCVCSPQGTNGYLMMALMGQTRGPLLEHCSPAETAALSHPCPAAAGASGGSVSPSHGVSMSEAAATAGTHQQEEPN